MKKAPAQSGAIYFVTLGDIYCYKYLHKPLAEKMVTLSKTDLITFK